MMGKWGAHSHNVTAWETEIAMTMIVVNDGNAGGNNDNGDKKNNSDNYYND